MARIRVIVDLEAEGDVTNKTAETVAEKVKDYSDSVVGPVQLAEKQGETSMTWHIHHGDAGQCQDCRVASKDGLG